jgi:acetyltransferase
MTIRHLDRLLQPRSVVVFGASDRPARVGTATWRNLRAGGFAGTLAAVNPRLHELDGVPVAARAADLAEVPDLAVLCTPPDTIAGLVAELGALGTRAAIVMTAGLSAAQKQAALDAARPHVLRLLGPNCLGLLSPHIGLNASFAHVDALPGGLAFVSQSGALLTAVLDWARGRHIGFSHLVSLGEHCDVDFGDLLDHLASDAHTRAILLYIESIEAPRKFMSAARAAARNKPVIVVKAGRAGQGVKAASSHTGALAGSDIVYDAALRRAGMLRVDTLAQLFTAAETLARLAGPVQAAEAGERLTIVTNGGGAGVMAADAAAAAGVDLVQPADGLLQALDTLLPANWSRANPVDLIGDAPVERYTATLRTLLADPAAGTVLLAHAPTAIVRSEDIARACLPLVRAPEARGRVMSCWLGDGAVAAARRMFEEAGVADYPTPEDAVQAFAMLQTYRRNQEALLQTPAASENPVPDLAAARALMERAAAEGRAWLNEDEAKALLAAYGVPVVPTLAVAATADAAVAAARGIGFPVVLKIRSPQVTHKSDVGGVRLDLQNADEVAAAATAMLAAVQAARPDAHVDGFTVQPMVRRPHARELIVGAHVDNTFGPVLLFGQGGIAVELAADRAVALPPLNRSLACELVSRTRVSRLLGAHRDQPAVKAEAVQDTLLAVSQMLADLPQLAELDINPLWADEQGVLAADARVRVAAQPVGGAERFAIRPYPDPWVRTLAWEGRDITLRPVRPEDEPQHRRFIERLDPRDIRLRIFGSRRTLPHSELARLVQIDYEREMAFVAVEDGDDGAQTLGVARALRDPDNVEAEFALIVRSDLQRRGLGRLLMQQLLAWQRAQGTQRLAGLVLRENAGMLALARELGFTIGPEDEDGVVRVVLPLL